MNVHLRNSIASDEVILNEFTGSDIQLYLSKLTCIEFPEVNIEQGNPSRKAIGLDEFQSYAFTD